MGSWCTTQPSQPQRVSFTLRALGVGITTIRGTSNTFSCCQETCYFCFLYMTCIIQHVIIVSPSKKHRNSLLCLFNTLHLQNICVLHRNQLLSQCQTATILKSFQLFHKPLMYKKSCCGKCYRQEKWTDPEATQPSAVDN